MPQVQVIQPIQQQPKRLRVAAYARVSSDSEDQLNSLSVQVDYYTHLIQENPNWDFAGIYADEGITGTSTKHREQFNRLLDDCRAGLIDRVLVKSASRFARNTADALASVREMKSLGVTVVFEKEGFDTETSNGEMILSMICATAQEESLSISKNLKWGIRKRMQDGTYLNGMSPFGYEKQESQLIPIEREAEIVRYIYSSFLVGVGTVQIAEELNRRYPKENGTWYVSVDRKDSISIESQIDFCKYELKGGSCRVFKDKGYSGKNTDRPEFQKLLGEIRKGKVRRVVVYKLDRISRSILDFANMMELFQEYDVEFVSSTEKFDTSTPMGRAMLNICIVFAQLERETIQKRVTDAYYSRCLKGFHMSGQAPYGFDLEPTVVENIRTKMMVADPIAASHVRLMFEMYAEPETSFGDITRYFEERGIKVYGKSLTRSYLSQLLRNPVYAQADLEMYEFFKSQGTVVVNDAADFAGTNGCYLYQGRDVKEDKDKSLKDQILVIAPHEGFVSADVWLRCRKKLMTNTTFQNGRKARNTWLAGKIKCGKCGYALKTTHNPSGYEYLRCSKRADHKGCPGCGTLRKTEFEQFIFTAMGEKFREFKLLRGGEEKANPKITAYQVELAQVEAEIEKLLDTLTGANATLLAYANKKIEDLDNRRKTLSKAIADLSVETLSSQQIELLSGYLDDWENISFEDKRKAADGLISSISATSDYVKIEWKI